MKADIDRFWRDVVLIMNKAEESSSLHDVALIDYIIQTNMLPREKVNRYNIVLFLAVSLPMIINFLRHLFESFPFLHSLRLLIYAAITYICTFVPEKHSAPCYYELHEGDVEARIRSNHFRLNPDKTKFVWCSTTRRLKQIVSGRISVGTVMINQAYSICNLGMIMDQDSPCRRTSESSWTPVLFYWEESNLSVSQ